MVKGKNKAGQRKAIKAKQGPRRVPLNPAGVSKLPKTPGVYTINSNGQRSYIGSTNNLQRRAKEHLRNGNNGTSLSYKRAVTRKQAFAMEKNTIKRSCPTTNRIKPANCKGFWESLFGF